MPAERSPGASIMSASRFRPPARNSRQRRSGHRPKDSRAGRSSKFSDSVNSTVYLDFAATTPVAPEVAAVMANFLGSDGVYANPSSNHLLGVAASNAVEAAREQVAILLGCPPDEIVWTSGATESTNIALQGIIRASSSSSHIVTTAVEHSATLETVRELEKQGAEVTWVRPAKCGGIIDSKAIIDALQDNTVVVSIIHVNNETGDIFPDFSELASCLRDRGVLLHVDAAQAASRVMLHDCSGWVDLMSLSGHKIYGPKGVGVLRVAPRAARLLSPVSYGGGQERGIRPGTVATHQVVGMGTAAALLSERLSEDITHLDNLTKQFCQGLLSIEGATVNGTPLKAPGIINVHLDGISVESLFVALDGFAISRGSACSSAGVEPSHVLQGLGYAQRQCLDSFRVSFGRTTTRLEVDTFLEHLTSATPALRELAA